jgi:hypothetical protein
MCSVRTDSKASATTDAPFGEEHDFWLNMYTLRVLTPETTKRTTLKKNSCSDAWSVMNREPLNIKDETLYCIHCSSFLIPLFVFPGRFMKHHDILRWSPRKDRISSGMNMGIAFTVLTIRLLAGITSSTVPARSRPRLRLPFEQIAGLRWRLN